MSRDVRPWGEYVIISSDEGYQVKVITINPNSRLSLQKHKHRAETWFILDGSANITIGDVSFIGHAGQSFYVPVGVVHRIGASNQTVRFLEVQTGSYFGEDDIERLEDDFGRG